MCGVLRIPVPQLQVPSPFPPQENKLSLLRPVRRYRGDLESGRWAWLRGCARGLRGPAGGIVFASCHVGYVTVVSCTRTPCTAVPTCAVQFPGGRWHRSATIAHPHAPSILASLPPPQPPFPAAGPRVSTVEAVASLLYELEVGGGRRPCSRSGSLRHSAAPHSRSMVRRVFDRPARQPPGPTGEGLWLRQLALRGCGLVLAGRAPFPAHHPLWHPPRAPSPPCAASAPPLCSICWPHRRPLPLPHPPPFNPRYAVVVSHTSPPHPQGDEAMYRGLLDNLKVKVDAVSLRGAWWLIWVDECSACPAAG